MGKEFTVSMHNNLGQEIQPNDVTVEFEITDGWRLIHKEDDLLHGMSSDRPIHVPTEEGVPEDETMEVTFVVEVSPAHPTPTGPDGELSLRFTYDDVPLRDITLYLPPGRQPEKEE